MSQTNRGRGATKLVLRIKIPRIDIANIGKILLMSPKNAFTRLLNARLRWRMFAAIAVILLADIFNVFLPFFQDHSYALGKSAALLPESSTVMADRVKFDNSQQIFNFNQQPKAASSIGRNLTAPAVLHSDASKGIQVSDPKNNIDFTMTPLYHLAAGKQQGDRIVYPMIDGTGWAVYTLQGIGVKEDIILSYAPGDTMSYKYHLQLGSSLKAKVESDGSLGIYGNTLFAGNISTGTDKDAQLLQKARQNAPKNTLLFVIPKPVVNDSNGQSGSVTAGYSLNGDELTVNVKGLSKGKYPLTIDPSIYVVTASQFMYGNNETNINFDVANKLIKKGKTTGARFNSWTSTTGLTAGDFGGSTAVAGGYIYSVGGASFSGQVFSSQGAGTYTVPSGVTSVIIKAWGGGGGSGGGSTGAGGGAGGGSGYVTGTFTVTPGDTLNVYVGGAGQGGTYSSAGAGAGGGGSGGGYSSVINQTASNLKLAYAAGGAGGGGGRQNTAGGAAGPGGCTTSGTACNGTSVGTGASGSGATNSAGGAAGTNSSNNDGTAGSSLTGGAGADGRSSQGVDGSGATAGLATGGAGGLANITTTRSGGGGGGSGYFGGGGASTTTSSSGNAGGGGGGGASYTDAGGTSVTATAGSGTTPGNSSDTDRNGAGGGAGGAGTAANGSAGSNGIVLITAGGSTKAAQTVNWAKFNTSSGTIDSPDPGSGTCSGWCSSSDYNLPVTTGANGGRSNYSLVAYNGYLYVIGGNDANVTRQNTVLISKLGANGEPQLWHPTDANKANWVYWYQDSNLNSIRSLAGAVAYNNRMYLVGGLGVSSTTPVTTVEYANITPNGKLGTWTSTTALGTAVYGNSVQVYNDRLYSMGGASTVGGAPNSTVLYNKINSDGTLNAWTSTTSFANARMAIGGNFSVIWGGYVYVSSGCGVVNGSGYCTTIQSSAEVASINADGSLDVWNTMGGVSDSRIGHNLVAWRNNIYEVGGCSAQNASTGSCDTLLNTINYGAVNQDGDASTVGSSVASGSGTCSGGSPTNCNLPGSANIGDMLTAAVVYNGYLYVIGGCTADNCNTQSANTAYVAISAGGVMSKPATCPSGAYQGTAWCVDTVHTISGGVAASSPLVFNGRIYLVGGMNGASNVNVNLIYYTAVNTDGSIGAYSSTSMSGISATSVSFTYAYARANPSSAGSNPGNLYIFGGCSSPSSGGGCTGFTDAVYKCNIGTSGAPASCSTTSQLQIGTIPTGSSAGLAAMGGTVYANYVYLVGGQTPDFTQLNSVRYAKIDNSNNIVTAGSGWVQSTNTLATARQRSSAFGYNGYLYAVGGYDGSGGGVLSDIEFIKFNTSDGSLGSASDGWHTSAVTINQRWGLTVPVSNSYAYVIGGCTSGAAPSCSTRSDNIQTFQLYNNASGGTAGFSAGNTIGADRIGGSTAVLNGYIYYAGGCTNIGCTAFTNTTFYAPLDAYGAIGTWSSGGTLPASLTFGKLLAAGGTLYYIGGQTGNATTTAVGTIYYTSSFSTGNPTWNGSAATKGIGDSGSGAQTRTQFGAAVWNNRLYILGGYNSSGTVQTTVYSSPQLSSGGNITTNWTDGGTSPANTAFNVARAGLSVVAYANNLYVLGGFDGTNYLSDTQFAQINTTNGSVGSWSYSESLPVPIQQGDAFAANGYIYLIGGRTASTTCTPNTLIAPISANTTIASGNNPTGVGAWYRANNEYTGDRYGNGAAYSNGKTYVLGGGCSSFVAAGDRTYVSAVKSQPQVAKYSIMFDNDTDVYPDHWLLNGVDNSIGASWQLTYRSMTDPGHVWSGTTGQACSASTMSDWGQATTVSSVTLGLVSTYSPVDGSGTNTNCNRYFYMSVTIDASPTFGYPDDVSRGPTITDLTLHFSAAPAKRLMHGRTFVGGTQMPDDTPYY